jgi:hypothetical protein
VAVRVFKTLVFSRFARKERIADEALCDAVSRAERGLIDADLGGFVIKQRVARKGQGRSSGFRTIIAFRVAERSVFLFGFAKNEMDNVSDRELAQLRQAARIYMALSESDLSLAVAEHKLLEVDCDGAQVQE